MSGNRIALTIDVEDWVAAIALVRSKETGILAPLGEAETIEREAFVRSVDDTLQILRGHRLRATFFIVADLVTRYPGLVERVAGDGHEVGCHGYFHYCKYDPRADRMLCSIDEFVEWTAKAKGVLEEAAGQDVIGYRAPGGYVSGAMLDALEKMGFLYDSSVSVNSVYRKVDTQPEGVCSAPYFPRRGSISGATEPRALVEFPWPYFTLAGARFPTAGGPFLRFFGSRYATRGLRESLRRGNTCFYFHPIDIVADGPRSLGKSRPLYFLRRGRPVRRSLDRVLAAFTGQWCMFRELREAIAREGIPAVGRARRGTVQESSGVSGGAEP